MHHPKSSTERIIIPWEFGGRGLADIKDMHNRQLLRLREYFLNKRDTEVYKSIIINDHGYTALKLADNTWQPETTQPLEKLMQSWRQKELHGSHAYHLDHDYVDNKASNLWLRRGELRGETVGFVIAIQDRVIATKNYRRYILKDDTTNDKCRRCSQAAETIEHLIGGCPTLAAVDYTKRHNDMAKIVHQTLARNCKLHHSSIPYYKYNPTAVIENDEYRIYWDRPLITDQSVRANRPDIVLLNKRCKTAELIDVAVPLNANLQKTYAEKVNKYVDLAEEIKDMWHLKKVTIRPLIISATGIVPKSLVAQLAELNISLTLATIQKAILMDTCHIVRRFLSQ